VIGEVGVDIVDHFMPYTGQWVERYVGWYVPLTRKRTCGHKHEFEERALKCAQTRLNAARRDSLANSRGE